MDEEEEAASLSNSKIINLKPDLLNELRPIPPPGSRKIELGWVNKVIALLFAGWKESPVFTSKVSEALEKSANKDLPHYLGKIAISDFRIDGQAP